MRIIYQNLRELAKKQPLFLCLLAAVQAIAIFCLAFIIGVIINNKLFMERSDWKNSINIILNVDSGITYADLEETLFYISEEVLSGIKAELYVSTYYDRIEVSTEVSIENGEYKAGIDIKELVPLQLVSGRTFTDDDMNSSVPMAITGNLEETEFAINGKELEIIGSVGFHDFFTEALLYVNPAAIKDLKLAGICIYFGRYITEEQNQQIIEQLDEVMAGKYDYHNGNIAEEHKDADAAMKAVILACVLIGLILVGTIGIILNHILHERAYKLSVFRLTGCSSMRSLGIFLGELLMISIPSLLTGLGVFVVVQKKWLESIYPYMVTYLNYKVYFMLFVGLILLMGLFAIPIILIKVCRPVNKQLAKARK